MRTEMRVPLYPFTATVGQEDVKACLLYCLVNPRVGGVLISGECGAGKTTLVRGLADLVKDMRIVELPLGATEDRLLGTLDVGAAITRGEKRFEPGFLNQPMEISCMLMRSICSPRIWPTRCWKPRQAAWRILSVKG